MKHETINIKGHGACTLVTNGKIVLQRKYPYQPYSLVQCSSNTKTKTERNKGCV